MHRFRQFSLIYTSNHFPDLRCPPQTKSPKQNRCFLLRFLIVRGTGHHPLQHWAAVFHIPREALSPRRAGASVQGRLMGGWLAFTHAGFVLWQAVGPVSPTALHTHEGNSHCWVGLMPPSPSCLLKKGIEAGSPGTRDVSRTVNAEYPGMIINPQGLLPSSLPWWHTLHFILFRGLRQDGTQKFPAHTPPSVRRVHSAWESVKETWRPFPDGCRRVKGTRHTRCCGLGHEVLAGIRVSPPSHTQMGSHCGLLFVLGSESWSF